MSFKKVRNVLIKKKNDEKRKVLQSFFKTGKGEYGEGDLFLGVSVPEIRFVAKHFKGLMLEDIQELLRDKYHEVRLCGLFLLVEKYEFVKKQNLKENKKIVDFYLKNLKYVNNWDLVDLSCYKILGDYLTNKVYERKILYKLAKSENVWERRVSIVSTMSFIRLNDLDDVFLLSEKLLFDKEDLMHKAVGWMLREAGKRNELRLKNFLKKHVRVMPRTMFRYAIEKFSESERQKYLKM
jgi:3-methyladenine DNA glycosylase AlkD